MTGSTHRKLVLLRHAKSAWPDLPDHERPLAGRGRRDAPVMGRWLRKAGHVPDQVLCSTARRASETWQLAQPALKAAPPAIAVLEFTGDLAAAGPGTAHLASFVIPQDVRTGNPPGPGNNKAFGHCNLPDGNNGTCVFTGGTGKFTHFHATITVSWLGGLNYHWQGPYSFSPQ